jgi:hypothetical protein
MVMDPLKKRLIVLCVLLIFLVACEEYQIRDVKIGEDDSEPIPAYVLEENDSVETVKAYIAENEANQNISGRIVRESVSRVFRANTSNTTALMVFEGVENCTDGGDNDGDGYVDGLDIECRGERCNAENDIWLWSHRNDEEQTDEPPRGYGENFRVACCAADNCANRRGECSDRYDLYGGRRLCVDNHLWEICDVWEGQSHFSEDRSHICLCCDREQDSRWYRYEVPEVSCFDGGDNDNDTYIDSWDLDCEGVQCEEDGQILTYSYRLDYDDEGWFLREFAGRKGRSAADSAPRRNAERQRRVGCCPEKMCRTANGACVEPATEDFDSYSGTNIDLICNTDQDWYRCNDESNNLTLEIEEIAYRCDGSSWDIVSRSVPEKIPLRIPAKNYSPDKK